MPSDECPRCHRNSLPDPQTGYIESGLCPECEEELDRIESDREDPEDKLYLKVSTTFEDFLMEILKGKIKYDPFDIWDTLEEWRGER